MHFRRSHGEHKALYASLLHISACWPKMEANYIERICSPVSFFFFFLLSLYSMHVMLIYLHQRADPGTITCACIHFCVWNLSVYLIWFLPLRGSWISNFVTWQCLHYNSFLVHSCLEWCELISVWINILIFFLSHVQFSQEWISILDSLDCIVPLNVSELCDKIKNYTHYEIIFQRGSNIETCSLW